jgi:hypothetical protein
VKKALAAALAVAGALIAVPAASATPLSGSCPDEPASSQPFLDYGDDDFYFLAPAGDFESGASGWSLSNGASLIDSPAGTGVSLSLPPGASATSPEICVTLRHVSARLFGEAFDGPRRDRSRINVDVAGLGGLLTADRNIRVGESWEPTRQFRLGASFFDLDPITGTTQIRLVFTAGGPATAVLDNLYVDPRARD